MQLIIIRNRFSKVSNATARALLFAITLLFPFVLCAQEMEGNSLSTLDKFMQDVFDDGMGAEQSNIAETFATDVRTIESTEKERTEAGDKGLNNAKNSGVNNSIDSISKLALMEEEAASIDFSMLKSEIVNSYRYLSIGEDSKFAKSLNKVIMDTEDSELKAEAYYWIGLIRMKNENYKKAGQSFLDGYKQGQEGLFGVYNLFGLAKSMKALEKKEESCAATTQLLKIISQETEDMVYPVLLRTKAQEHQSNFCK